MSYYMSRQSPLVALRNEIKQSIQNKKHDEALEHMKQCAELSKKDEAFMEILEESLEWVCTEGFVEGTSFLLGVGVEPDAREVHGNSALTLAAERGHAHIVTLLLQHGACVNKTDNETRSALHWSAMNGHVDVVQQLMEHGAWHDTPDALYGFTPLLLAARQGHHQILELLLSKGCDVDRTDLHKETALFDAVRNGQLRCVEHLINAGSCLDHVDMYGRSLLFTAVLYNQVAVAAALLRANVDMERRGVMVTPVPGQHTLTHTLRPKFSPLQVTLIETKLHMAQLLYIAGANRFVLHEFMPEAERRVVASMDLGRDPEALADAHMRAWLRAVGGTPRSLREACRVSIRAAVGSTRWRTAHAQLPLPQALLHFLTIPELEPFLKVPKQSKRFLPSTDPLQFTADSDDLFGGLNMRTPAADNLHNGI